MYGKMKDHLSKTLAEIKEAGLYKEERLIESAQQAAISVKGKEVLNFCANNYLGLSNHPRLIAAAQQIMERRGYGMSSVRFICGTQDIHKELEAAISDYFKTEDTILYAACFDANGGVFEPLFTEEDAIISDSLNHASIIDGVRLCKAKRYRYANADMADLERCLQEAQAQRFRIVVTDGVFSMDGNVAPMDCICDLAEKYDALVMVDESHSAGVVGPTGHGVSEQYGTYGRAWTSIPELWAKPLAALWEDSLPDARKSSTCYANAAVRTSSPTHWLRASSAPASRYSRCSKRAMPCMTNCWKT